MNGDYVWSWSVRSVWEIKRTQEEEKQINDDRENNNNEEDKVESK